MARARLSTIALQIKKSYNNYMNQETLFKISDEVAKRFKDLFATPDFVKEMEILKDADASDNGTFRMVISTDHTDRHGEIVSQDGWQLENYLKNPVVLWGHESYQIPVGITDKLFIEVTDGVKKLVAEGRFAGHEFAQTLRKLYDAGMLKASSVGFIPLEYEGNKITKAELLEWSFVSIPANPHALDTLKNLGMDASVLMAKGFLKEIDGAKEGDEVITLDEEEKKDDEEPTPEDLEKVDGEVEEGTITEDGDEKTMTLNLAGGKKMQFKLSGKFFDAYNDVINKRVEKEVIEKSGRVLSKANKEKIINAKIALEEVIAMAEEESSENAIDVSEDKSANEVQEAEDFLKLRKGLQGVFADLQTILTDAKSIAKEKGIKTR